MSPTGDRDDAPPTLELPRRLEASLAAGHPWVYRDQIPATFRARSGQWVRARAGGWVGYALWDDESSIALRVYSQRGIPDDRWIAQRVRAAWQLRSPLHAAGITGFRWLNGEGDGLPGVVVDRYGDAALLVTYARSLETIVPLVTDAIASMGVVTSLLRRSEDGEGRLEALFGHVPQKPVVIDEHGVRLAVDLARGQKTGLFLDQRDNRRFVGTLSAERTILNLFAYTGAFSLHAVRGGARSVTSVDSAAPAIQAARDNFALNGVPPDDHEFVVADVFEYLREVHQARRQFDLVICDPPSFAKSRDQRERALTAYVRLNAQALGAVARGGLYAAASCTSQVGPEAFVRMLSEAAHKAKRRLQIIHEAGQALDHPQLAGHPEGRYLKFVVGRVLDAV